jgi:1,2-phenylacetyl-CoA epoxidase catalytic subunit
MVDSSKISKSEYLKEAIFDLLNLIERANNSILRHKSLDDPDTLAIEGFKRIRQQYIDELNQMMTEFGLHVDDTKLALAA